MNVDSYRLRYEASIEGINAFISEHLHDDASTFTFTLNGRQAATALSALGHEATSIGIILGAVPDGAAGADTAATLLDNSIETMGAMYAAVEVIPSTVPDEWTTSS